MEVRGASLGVAKAMLCPRMLFTITVMGYWEVAASMLRQSQKRETKLESREGAQELIRAI